MPPASGGGCLRRPGGDASGGRGGMPPAAGGDDPPRSPPMGRVEARSGTVGGGASVVVVAQSPRPLQAAKPASSAGAIARPRAPAAKRRISRRFCHKFAPKGRRPCEAGICPSSLPRKRRHRRANSGLADGQPPTSHASARFPPPPMRGSGGHHAPRPPEASSRLLPCLTAYALALRLTLWPWPCRRRRRVRSAPLRAWPAGARRWWGRVPRPWS